MVACESKDDVVQRTNQKVMNPSDSSTISGDSLDYLFDSLKIKILSHYNVISDDSLTFSFDSIQKSIENLPDGSFKESLKERVLFMIQVQKNIIYRDRLLEAMNKK